MLYWYNVRQSWKVQCSGLDSSKCLFQIGNQIVDMLRADRQTDSARINFLFCKFLRVELRMSGTCRMNDQ